MHNFVYSYFYRGHPAVFMNVSRYSSVKHNYVFIQKLLHVSVKKTIIRPPLQ